MVNPAVFFLPDILRSGSVHNAAASNCNPTKMAAYTRALDYSQLFQRVLAFDLPFEIPFFIVAVRPSSLHFDGKFTVTIRQSSF